MQTRFLLGCQSFWTWTASVCASFLILLGIAGTTPQDAAAQESVEAKADLQSAIAAGWARLVASDEALKSYTIHSQWSRTLAPALKRSPEKRDKDIRVMKGKGRVLLEYPSELVAGNPEYGFTLSRKSPTVPWVLAEVTTETPGQSTVQKLHSFPSSHAAYLYPTSWFMLPGPELVKTLKDGQLKVTSHRQEPGGLVRASIRLQLPPVLTPEEAKRLEQEVKHFPPEKRELALRNLRKQVQEQLVFQGEIVLDPTLHYVIVEGEGGYTSRPSQQQTFKRKVRRVSASAEMILCERASWTVKSPNATIEDTDTYTTFNTELASDDTFYLSHYNFPEPLGVTPPPVRRPLWLYLLIGGVAFIGLAVGFRFCWKWMARKEKPSRDSP
jgi:hypothetical protein